MNELFRVTELLYASWILSTEKEMRNAFPNQKILTYALKSSIDKGAFPQWMREELHFVDGRTGLCCVEILTIEEYAAQMKLTRDHDVGSSKQLVEANTIVAERALIFLNVKREDARRWGKELRAAVEEFETQLDLYNA